MNTLPRTVAILTNKFNAAIVGSSADPNVENPRDFDVVVPYSKWNEASSIIPLDARPNTFGGWKFIDDGIEVDVWPGEINDLIPYHKTNYIWFPSHGKRFEKMNDLRTMRNKGVVIFI